MDNHYDSARSTTLSSSSLTSRLAMPRFSVPTGRRPNGQDLLPLSGHLNPSTSRNHTNITTESFHSWFDNTEDSSTLGTVFGSRFTEEIKVGVGQRYGPGGWTDGPGEPLGSVDRGISSGTTMPMDGNWDGTGYSRDAILSSPQSSSVGSDFVPDLVGIPWNASALNVDGEHIAESACSENDASDGYGGLHTEPDRRNRQFDNANLESLGTKPMPCLLENCRSKYLFPTFQSFNSHIKNVHKKAVFCSEPGCTFGRPFANNTDLKRHGNAIHKDKKPFKCERQHCPRKVKAWPRKDKLKLHNKKYHSNFRCFFCSESPPHQRWFDTESELFAHCTSGHPIG